VADGDRQYLLLADKDLMPLVETGDAEAFATFYDRHGRAAYSLAYGMMGEKQEAEDVVQEAFIKVWRSAGGYRAAEGEGIGDGPRRERRGGDEERSCHVPARRAGREDGEADEGSRGAAVLVTIPDAKLMGLLYRADAERLAHKT
jgi:Sigma-70 region 2